MIRYIIEKWKTDTWIKEASTDDYTKGCEVYEGIVKANPNDYFRFIKLEIQALDTNWDEKNEKPL